MPTALRTKTTGCRRSWPALGARRENDDTFTVRQWEPSGTTLVDTIASAQNLHVARAAFRQLRDVKHIAPKGNIVKAILGP
jgi:hypothetical protein